MMRKYLLKICIKIESLRFKIVRIKIRKIYIKLKMNKKIALVDRVTFLKEICEGKKVLHLGCTDYPYHSGLRSMTEDFLHFELDKIAKELYGFDFDEKGIQVLEETRCENLYQGRFGKSGSSWISTKNLMS